MWYIFVILRHSLIAKINLPPKETKTNICYKKPGDFLVIDLLYDTKNSEPLYIRAFRRLGNK